MPLRAVPMTAPAWRATLAASALGVAIGWSFANLGALAETVADDYGVALATVGLMTMALVLVHMLAQIPSGKVVDRFGGRRVARVGLAVAAATNALALAARDPALAMVARALLGIGTALCFVAGSDYIRRVGGSAFGQGIYGGAGLGGAGLALAILPHLEEPLGWRAPFLTASVLAALAFSVLALGPSDQGRGSPSGLRSRRASGAGGVLTDVRLYRLAAMHMAGMGLSIVVGNWIVTMLMRAGDYEAGTAGAIGALVLLGGVVSRPLGGWVMRHRPAATRVVLAASLVACALGALALTAARPAALVVAAAAVVGLAAGIPFAPAFTGAALRRPDAPAAAVALVNMSANLVVVIGTPLLGFAFSLPGDGRIGFFAVAGLWVVALLAVPSARELGVGRAGAAGSQAEAALACPAQRKG